MDSSLSTYAMERLRKDIFRQIEKMTPPECGTRKPCPQPESTSSGSAGDRGIGEKVLLAAGFVLFFLWCVLSRKHGVMLFPALGTVHELTMKKNDPLFPSESILSGAGLKLSEHGELDLPVVSLVKTAQEKAFQLLIGVRCGRNVRSGLYTSHKGDTVVRTGISCSLPPFCCETRNGELLSVDAPASLVDAVASRRTGNDRLTVANDGQWLVIQRIIKGSRHCGRTWLLLRQLRDISLAEFIIGGY